MNDLINILKDYKIRFYILPSNSEIYHLTSLKFIVDYDLTKLNKILLQNQIKSKIKFEDYYFSYQIDSITLSKSYLSIELNNRTIYIDSLQNTKSSIFPVEFRRAIENNWASKMLRAFLSNGLLHVLIPPLVQSTKIEGGLYHNENLFNHLLYSLDAIPAAHPLLKISALLHDIGKINTCKKQEGGKITFHCHEVRGVKIAESICKSLLFTSWEIEYITKMIRHHMFKFEKNTKDKTIKKFLVELGKSDWQDIFILRYADRVGNLSNKDKPATTKEMRDLKKRMDSLVDKTIFKEDIAITEEEICKIKNPIIPIKTVYSGIFGMIESQKIKNDKENIMKYVREYYGDTDCRMSAL